MELRHLRYFVAVAEELHFGRAARRLNIAQPALSQQIKALERELHVQVLLRTKREVRLTEPGRVFLHQATVVLDQLDEAIRLARLAEAGKVGRLRVGYPATVVSEITPAIIERFRSNHQEVDLELVTEFTGGHLDSIRKGRLDVAFVRVRDSFGGDLDGILIHREPLVVLCPEGHPLSSLRRVPLSTLEGTPLVRLSPRVEPALADFMVTRVFGEAAVPPLFVREVPSTVALYAAVASGVGLALVPRDVAQRLNMRGVTYRALSNYTPLIDMRVIWRRGDRSPLIGSFVQTAIEVAGEAEAIGQVDHLDIPS